MATPIPLKTCSKCGQVLPATTEYFHANRHKKSGLRSRCKVCEREYYQTNKEKITEYREANKDKRIEYDRERYQENRDEKLEYQKGYYQSNQDKRLEYNREYYQANRDKISEVNSEYREANKEKIAEWNRKWYEANPDKIRIYTINRRARKRALPDTFTEAQWIACLEYFNYTCAVCGNQLRDLFGNIEPHADHWLPLTSKECTGTVATNMVCLCSSCNLNKGAKMPDIWLAKRYGTRKANQILKRIEDYFQSLTT